MCSLDPNAFAYFPSKMTINRVFTPIIIPNIKAMSYPFSFIYSGNENDLNSKYYANEFCRAIPGDEVYDCGNFPNNIIEYYWIHEGENDVEPWMCLCKLNNGCYVFYSASCDYYGFNYQGRMELIISKNPNNLFSMGMTDKQRNQCLLDKNLDNI